MVEVLLTLCVSCGIQLRPTLRHCLLHLNTQARLIQTACLDLVTNLRKNTSHLLRQCNVLRHPHLLLLAFGYLLVDLLGQILPIFVLEQVDFLFVVRTDPSHIIVCRRLLIGQESASV